MSEPNAPTVQVIENATRDDVRPGDHVTWEHTGARDGVTTFERREGIAHHRESTGDWCSETGAWITCGEGDDITLTIRRPAQELPTEDGAVIVPAEGRDFIEATICGETYYARAALRSWVGDWYAAWRSGDRKCGLAASGDITPGTWKVAPQ